MNRRRWLSHIVLRAISHRKGRTLLLLAVLTMAASLAAALGIVSSTMEDRVAEETRKYGANLVVLPETARVEVGSGGLRFGAVSEPVYLVQSAVQTVLSRSGLNAEHSFHLQGALRLKGAQVPAQGVEFGRIRKLFPWWQVRGAWAETGGVMVGGDLAARLGLRQGELIELAGERETWQARVTGIVSTGGEEDGTLFLPLPEMQRLAQRPDQVSLVRLLVPTGDSSLAAQAARLQPLLPGAAVKEVRQVARTSEALLQKVQLLMLLVAAVVLACAGSSVAGTMSATVLERGKEIGLMKAMGGTRWDLLRIFASEALLLGCAGGVTGFLVGSLIAEFVARAVFSASADFAPAYFLVSLGVSIALALGGSLGPLLSVFRLDPVQSLRGE